jgi:hypothetical protein
LKLFLEFKTIRKTIKFLGTGSKPARGYSPRGAAAYYAWLTGTAARPRLGDSAQRGKRHVWPAAMPVCRTLATWSTRTVCVCDGAVARSPVARRRLDGGKVLPASTGGVPGRRQVRRVETGLTETVKRRWGGGKRPARRCSTAVGSLWWSLTCVEGSCSTGVEGGKEI